MGFQLTPASLRKICKENGLYSSDVSLNDVLHLQCKGICTLEPCLGEFTGLKTLYLEQNALSDLSGLAPLVNLRCLYLGRNMLESIKGLDSLLQLDSLDLSDNYLTQVSGLGHLSGTLRTLNLSGNKLVTCEAIRPLQQLTALNSLDLANNKLAEEEAVDLLAAMPLSLLRLVGNPVVGTYRCVHAPPCSDWNLNFDTPMRPMWPPVHPAHAVPPRPSDAFCSRSLPQPSPPCDNAASLIPFVRLRHASGFSGSHATMRLIPPPSFPHTGTTSGACRPPCRQYSATPPYSPSQAPWVSSPLPLPMQKLPQAPAVHHALPELPGREPSLPKGPSPGRGLCCRGAGGRTG